MSVLTLRANNHLVVSYTASWLGFVRYDVESELPIAVHILDAANLALWKSGQSAVRLGGTDYTTKFGQQLYIPGQTQWNLVLVNGNLLQSTAVYYNVQS